MDIRLTVAAVVLMMLAIRCVGSGDSVLTNPDTGRGQHQEKVK